MLPTLLRLRFFSSRVWKKKKQQLVEGWRISPLENKNRDLRGGEIDAARNDLHRVLIWNFLFGFFDKLTQRNEALS